MPISDEMLMAYADGELDASGMAEVEQAMAQDETLATRAAVFADTRRTVKQAYGETAPPVSADLEARVRAMLAPAATSLPPTTSAPVIDLASRRKPAFAMWQTGIAASVALAVGLTAGWFIAGSSPAGTGGPQFATVSDRGVLQALAGLASGTTETLPDGRSVRAIASFRTPEGTLCREFEQSQPTGQTHVAIACHDAGSWDLRFAVATTAASDGFAPASSLDALDAYLSATDAGQPLSPADEAAALSGLPRP